MGPHRSWLFPHLEGVYLFAQNVSQLKVKKQETLAELVKSNSLKSKSKVTSDVLKSICSDSGVSLRGREVKLSTGGKPLQVKIGNPQYPPKKPRFTHESLKRLQASYNFSDRAIK